VEKKLKKTYPEIEKKSGKIAGRVKIENFFLSS